MRGTFLAQTLRNDVNAGGQFSKDRSVGTEELPWPLDLGKGTEGGLVVQRKAAKYKQRAGPVIMTSPSALLNSSSSTSLSTFAWVKDDLR